MEGSEIRPGAVTPRSPLASGPGVSSRSARVRPDPGGSDALCDSKGAFLTADYIPGGDAEPLNHDVLPPKTSRGDRSIEGGGVDLSGRLLSLARVAKGAAMTASGMVYGPDVDKALDELRDEASALVGFDPRTGLESREEALAFWINLYNALVMHGALAMRVQRSMQELPGFFGRAVYDVGGLRYSLDIIEHGLLRANRGHPRRLGLPQLSPWDRRRASVIRPMDVRIHFALNCGAAACPMVRHYQAEAIDAQLDLAARAFVNGGGVRIDPARGCVLLSRIFLWYSRDFGISKRGKLRRLRPFIEETRRDEIEQAAKHGGIRYDEYDWSFR